MNTTHICGVALSGCAALFFVMGCQSEEDRASAEIFREDVQPLFEARCALKCHVEGAEDNEGLLLGSDHGPDTIVNVPSVQADMSLVEPGSLEDSYLWHKLQSTHRDVGGSGEAMPYAQPMLEPDDLAKVEEYILAL